MKRIFGHFSKGFLIGTGTVLGTAAAGWLLARIGLLPEWGVWLLIHLAPPDTAIWTIRLYSALVVCLCILIAFLRHYLRLLVKVWKSDFDAEMEAVSANNPELGKPSQNAFGVLVFFSRIMPQNPASFTEVAISCNLTRNDAKTCIKELKGFDYIEAIYFSQNEWEGRYAITDKGWMCLRHHGS